MKFITLLIFILTIQFAYAKKASDKMRITRLEWAVLDLNFRARNQNPPVEFVAILPNSIRIDITYKAQKGKRVSQNIAKAASSWAKREALSSCKKMGISEKINLSIKWDPL